MAFLISFLLFGVLLLICAPVYQDFFQNTLKGKPTSFPQTYRHLWMRLTLLIMPPVVIIGSIVILLMVH